MLFIETHNQVLQLTVTTSGKKKMEENWSERLLLKVYIICYFSVIIFSIIEIENLAIRLLAIKKLLQNAKRIHSLRVF